MHGPIVITRNGKAVAVLLAPYDDDDLERILPGRSPGGFKRCWTVSDKASRTDKGCPTRISGRLCGSELKNERPRLPQTVSPNVDGDADRRMRATQGAPTAIAAFSWVLDGRFEWIPVRAKSQKTAASPPPRGGNEGPCAIQR